MIMSMAVLDDSRPSHGLAYYMYNQLDEKESLQYIHMLLLIKLQAFIASI